MNEKEFRVLAKHCYFIGKTKDEAEQWLERCYTNIENATVPEKKTICRWYEEFEQAENAESTSNDATESGKDGANSQNQERRPKAPASFDQSCLCDICGKEFARTDVLKKHRRIHSNNAEYQCKSCGRQFRDRRNLQVKLPHL